MSLDEFWHGDMRLLEVYQKAYLRDVSYRSWQQGLYNYIAYDTKYYNTWGKKKGERNRQYPDWKDPIPKISRTKITKENREIEARKEQLRQNAWFANMLHKK